MLGSASPRISLLLSVLGVWWLCLRC